MTVADAEVTAAEIERLFREHHRRAVAVLTRAFGDVDVAEDAVGEALIAALVEWPRSGVPASPAGWWIQTARHRALDRVRREASRGAREAEAARRQVPDDLDADELVVRDDQLRLMFLCCHPALSLEAQVALTLRHVGGLSTTAIARAFVVPDSTLAQRLVRAKRKIRDANIPLRLPDEADLAERWEGVLAVVYLIFHEGYAAAAGDALVRDDLCAEALRLGRLVVELSADAPEPMGLLALMLLAQSRRRARVGPDGELVPLARQDRNAWDAALVAEGHALVRRCLARGAPGPYQIQAAIQAVHADAADVECTDWAQILALYDQLVIVAPSPVVSLHRAVALAEVAGPTVALRAVDGIAAVLDAHHLLHAVRGDLLERVGQLEAAAVAFDAAATRTHNEVERRFLCARSEASRRRAGQIPARR